MTWGEFRRQVEASPEIEDTTELDYINCRFETPTEYVIVLPGGVIILAEADDRRRVLPWLP